ncbi:hypothetical protein Pan97_10720 [Bremerella volcania]|uniref:Uncharacterized protein n=1 Tax=Bremerella volcania TaxID=2527984 RepID=A0A518C4B8_9BACT|nr:hypothetical protein [Bremerella volcania]QDU74068.1 hypothetical protein Pan97_10720 [Bremerella volcania]
MTNEPTPTPEKPDESSLGWILGIGGSTLAIVLIVLFSMGEFSSPTRSSSSTASDIDPAEQKFRDLVEYKLGDNVRLIMVTDDTKAKEKKNVHVSFDIGDNLTTGMIQLGARADIKTILKAAADSGLAINELTVEGEFPMTDAYGSSTKKVVVDVMYLGSTIERIDWNGFLTDNVYKVADKATVHPSFR